MLLHDKHVKVIHSKAHMNTQQSATTYIIACLVSEQIPFYETHNVLACDSPALAPPSSPRALTPLCMPIILSIITRQVLISHSCCGIVA